MMDKNKSEYKVERGMNVLSKRSIDKMLWEI